MATVIVFEIPYWRRFVIHIPEHYQLFHDAVSLYRKKTQHRIFLEIELGNDEAALRLATPKGIKKWRGTSGESVIVAAIIKKRNALVLKLLGILGEPPNDGSLAVAAGWGDLNAVRAMINIGQLPDGSSGELINSLGKTPLMSAARSHNVKIVEALLSAGANVNAVSKNGDTAAMSTGCLGLPEDLEVLELLFQHKADITIKDARGRNLIREAVDRDRFSGRPEMRRLVERYYPNLVNSMSQSQ